MIYRAAVFDLDGTLLNTLADLAASGNELLASYGMKPHTQQAYRYFVGNGSRKLMERILPNASSGRIDEALARYKAIYERRLTEETAPYEGIVEMLSGLRERGVRLAVCTNKHINAAAQLIQKFFPSDMFDVFDGDRPGMPRKPDPAHVRFVMETMGVVPEETVYLGDSGVDMQTAVNSGTFPVGVLWGFREKEELLENGAKVLLSHPSELLEKVNFIMKDKE